MGNKPSTTTTTIGPTTAIPTTTYMPTTPFIDQRPVPTEQIIIGLLSCICIILVAAFGLFVYTPWRKTALACGSKSRVLDDETKNTDKPQVFVIANEHTHADVGKSKAQMMEGYLTYNDLTILRANAKTPPATEMTEYASVRIHTSEVSNT